VKANSHAISYHISMAMRLSANIPGRSVTILFCVLAALCEGIDLQAAGVAAAGIGAELKPSPDQFGTFFSASTFGLFFGALIGGRLADSIGRKKVMVASIGLFGLFSLLTSFASDIQSLIWARALTGQGPRWCSAHAAGTCDRKQCS
jgi:AAHS family 3-hydroxyphenylpropionic acid transporter